MWNTLWHIWFLVWFLLWLLALHWRILGGLIPLLENIQKQTG
jgi:hypothetical protein